VFERRTLDGGVTVLVPSTLEEEGFEAVFTERLAGVSPPPFAGLNLGFSSGDRPDLVLENRRRLCRALGIEGFALGHQVHGGEVTEVGPERATAGFEDPARTLPGTDALLARDPGVAVAVITADCLPVALADPASGAVAAVHAGWRGVAAGLLSRVLDRFADPSGLRAAVGPGIGPDHYEVGEEVVSAVDAATGGGARVERRDGRAFLDLPGTVAAFLRTSGVGSVEESGLCTACRGDRFYSYRREGRTGRQALVAWRR
jgi:polyphenol oxidase